MLQGTIVGLLKPLLWYTLAMKKPPRYLADFDLKDLPQLRFDVVVIGSGVAGISSVYHLGKDAETALLTKSELSLTATRYAQGGIAAAVGKGDSPESHFEDTIRTGRGLCDEEAVRVLVSEGPAQIETLRKIGAIFDTKGGRLNLTREAGHSFARVVHSKDTTGGEVEATLARTVKDMPNVSICERAFVLDILTDGSGCRGVLAVYNGKLTAFLAPAVILAAGGLGQLYATTTNPHISTGDGLAMAYRAGAALTDVEFVQFHPTALNVDVSPRFLISEAVRGEGAYLIDKNGVRFMVGRHKLAELAPRDVVVREEVVRMRETNDNQLYLDCRHMGREFFSKRFPAIYEVLVEHGIDMGKDLIPITPAAHYMSGGVKTDLDGRTCVPGLYAVGEVACTGVHGANRLASNSLLEGLVFSRRAAVAAVDDVKNQPVEPLKNVRNVLGPSAGTEHPARSIIARLRDNMEDNVGVVRSADSLRGALGFIDKHWNYLQPSSAWAADYELSNMLTAGMLIATAALIREESRGSHWREDFPEENDARWLKHISLMTGGEEPTVGIWT